VKYRVIVEVNADDPLDAINAVFEDGGTAIQVRQEPFDTPSPMWDVEDSSDSLYYHLKRLR
jgi:hypothetical protein